MESKKSKPVLVFWVLVALGMVAFGVYRHRHPETTSAPSTIQPETASSPSASPAARNFSPTQICSDALQPYAVIDHSSDSDLDRFDVPMQEGCFGKLIFPPKNWYRWRSQNADPDDHSGWVSFLIENQSSVPPSDMDQQVPITANNSFRVQGKGTVRIVKSD